MALSSKQLRERLNYVGGSDAATICGINPYKNIIDLWKEKTKREPIKDISDNPYVKAGNFLEPVVIQWFEHETGYTVTRVGETFYDDEHGCLAANLDGLISTPEGLAILEAKTASSDENWGETGSEEIPDVYLLQLVHYMHVMDVGFAYLAVLIRGVDFRWYKIKRNRNLEAVVIKRELDFWHCVLTDKAPEPKTGKEVISLIGNKSTEGYVLADDEAQRCVERLERVSHEIGVLQKEKEEITDRIKVFMGEKDTLMDPSGKIYVTWRSGKPIRRFDLETFKIESPSEYDKYSRFYTNSRRFLMK